MNISVGHKTGDNMGQEMGDVLVGLQAVAGVMQTVYNLLFMLYNERQIPGSRKQPLTVKAKPEVSVLPIEA